MKKSTSTNWCRVMAAAVLCVLGTLAISSCGSYWENRKQLYDGSVIPDSD